MATHNDSPCCEKLAEIVTGVMFTFLFLHIELLKSDLLCSFPDPHVDMQEMILNLILTMKRRN